MREFDGALLKPCLLQPCVHVAGPGSELLAELVDLLESQAPEAHAQEVLVALLML